MDWFGLVFVLFIWFASMVAILDPDSPLPARVVGAILLPFVGIALGSLFQ